MRKRNVAILFRLNKKEAEALDKKVKRSGLNREAYLRQLISGVVPRDAPPPDYYSMMRELHKIGNNLNQIAQEMKEQIKVLTEKIGTLRKEAALCDGIAARSKVIEEKFKMVREEKEKKEEQSHEHIRRSR